MTVTAAVCPAVTFADKGCEHGSSCSFPLDPLLVSMAGEPRPMYSIFTRKLEAAVLPTAQRYGLGVLTFSPLNGGWLSGHADHV